MELNEMILNINKNNEIGIRRNSYAVVETLITKILKQYILDKDKPVELHYREKKEQRLKNEYSSLTYDIYAPEGFDNFVGPTVIDIKFVSDKRALYQVVFNSIMRMYRDSTVKNIIFVCFIELDKEEIKNIEEYLRNRILKYNHSEHHPYIGEKNIYIWDVNRLNVIFKRYKKLYVELSNNVYGLLFNETVEKSLKTETVEEEISDTHEHIVELSQRYKQDELVLFLGAGISKNAGIATWDTLVYELLVSLISKYMESSNINLTADEQRIIVDSIKKDNGNSPLQLVRYIRHGLKDYFKDTLSHILYENSKDESEVLKAIARLCTPVRNRVGIQGVVNYNFDDLIEINFDKKEIPYRSVYREADLPSKNEIGIYHVHGFLPRNLKQYDNLTESLLVFSEEGYHSLMSDSYNWSNMTQLNYFREQTCLFIGVSMTDPNLRRLLEISMSKQTDNTCKHYIIFQKENIELEEDSQVDQDNLKKFQKVNEGLKETSLRELGLNVIWVENYDEIPGILDEIKNEV